MRSLIYIVPFCAFLVGYYSLYYWLPLTAITTPSLIGLPLTDACIILSKMQLAPRILQETIEPDIPAGTILHQIPAPGTTIRPHQVIDLVLAQAPPNQTAPDYRMMMYTLVEQDARTKGIKYKIYYVASTYPQGLCIGQWPAPAMALPDHRIILYIAHAAPNPMIIPDMRGLTLQEGLNFCLRHSLPEPTCHTSRNTAPSPMHTIIDQRPLPGSIMPLTALSFTFLLDT